MNKSSNSEKVYDLNVKKRKYLERYFDIFFFSSVFLAVFVVKKLFFTILSLGIVIFSFWLTRWLFFKKEIVPRVCSLDGLKMKRVRKERKTERIYRCPNGHHYKEKIENFLGI